MKNQELIDLLSPTDKKHFIKYLDQRNKRKDARNIDLFKAYLNGSIELFKTDIGVNAFYLQQKRLSDRLLDFIAGLSFETEATVEVSVIKRLLVAQKLFSFQKYKQGFKVLKMAENIASKINHYSLLNEIYYTFILYSHHSESPDQEELFIKFNSNKKDLFAEEQLNMAYAVIRKAFNNTEFRSETINLTDLITSVFHKFGISEENGYTFQSLFQLAEIADIQGAHEKNYHSVNLFFIDKVKALQGGPQDTEKHLSYHIDMLYLVANVYFRKKQFKISTDYLAQMLIQMNRFDGKFYEKNIIKYTTLYALNLNFSREHEKASEVLDQLLEDKVTDNFALLNPILVRIMIHFQQNELNEAKKLMSGLHYSDKVYEKHIGLEWILHKKYIEILLHIELGNTDYVDSRISSLIRTHQDYFKAATSFQILPFLKLVKQYYKDPFMVNSEEFRSQVKASIDLKRVEHEDIFLMCFYAWLKAKMNKQPVYNVTMELIETNL